MSTKINGNDHRKNNSSVYPKGSGSKYHEEHAGNVEGYGEPHPAGNTLNNLTKK